MDFDPGFHEEMYDEGFDDGYEEAEEDLADDRTELEHDDDGNVIGLATGAAVAAGFGYHMANDEIDERKLSEEILRKKEGKQGEPVKVPLANRNEVKGVVTPFGRWASKVNKGYVKTDSPIEYTKEEQLQILNAELEEYFDD